MSAISKMCCVCRLLTPNLIDLNYKEEAKDILHKLKRFIDLNVMEKDPTSKYICLPCYETLDVAYGFKRQCEKSMAASRLKEAKMIYKCKVCSMSFENMQGLEMHTVTHSIDLTDDDQTQAAPPKRVEEKNKNNKHKNGDDGFKIRFKIPVRPLKIKPAQPHRNSESHVSSKSLYNSASNGNSTSPHKRAPMFNHKCPICKHQFLNKAALSSHIRWHDIKEVQYKCPGCSLMFLKKVHMNQHIRHSH